MFRFVFSSCINHLPMLKLKFKFLKENRLLKRHDFKRVSREGKRIVGKYLCIDFRYAPVSRLGITASTHYGSSPERNRFKRLVREAFRLNPSILPQKLEINVAPRKLAKQAVLIDIQEELNRLLPLNRPLA